MITFLNSLFTDGVLTLAAEQPEIDLQRTEALLVSAEQIWRMQMPLDPPKFDGVSALKAARDRNSTPCPKTGTADQTIDQGGHDVHIEQAGGGEEGQQDAGQQAVLGNVRQAAARRRGGQNIVGHRHSPLIFAASTAAGDQSKIPLSPK